MAIKLYPLRNVPEDEVEEMCELLRTHEIDFHETNAGFFGIGTAAIWVKNPDQLALAQSLIEQYQQTRYTTARERYTERKLLGQQTRFIDLLQQNPFKVVLYIIIALLLLLLMAKPFWF